MPVKDGDQLLGFIAIHRGNKDHPAFGATRIEEYPSTESALSDVLDLSSLMSHKAALAGIPYGGANGVLFNGPHLKDKDSRDHALSVYAKHVDKLGGKFVTGSDAGVSQEDVITMRSHSPHIVGVEEDPTQRTAEGLLGSIFVTLAHVFGEPTLEGRTFAIQGVGKVGTAVLDLITPEAKEVYIADIDPKRVEDAKKKHPQVKVVQPEEIISLPVDVFIPCALGGVLNENTVENIQAKAIVGSANNQLSSNEVGDRLHEKGIVYAPDYVVNAGGLISVVHEYEKAHNKASEGDLTHDIAAIQTRLDHIFKESKKNGIPMHRIADTLAHMRIDELYPNMPQK
jgi:glutamate dehydrogenase/leucine dehydrogenase